MKYSLKVVSALTLVLAMSACGGGFKNDDAGSGGSSDSGNSSGEVSAEKVYRVSFNQPDTHPQFVAVTNLGKEMAKATNGKCSLRVFPNETLGDQKDSIELVQAGTLDFAFVGGPLMENFNPDFVVMNLPYTFESKEHQEKVLQDREIMGDLYDSLQDQKIQVVAGFHGGIRNVYNSKKPIEKPADLDGMKIRVMQSDTAIEMMDLMGGKGAPMSQGEVYTAIQSGVIDGGENNESIYANLKHGEIAPYYSYTRHMMFPDYVITNPKILKDMDPECSKFLEENWVKAEKEESKLWDKEIERSVMLAKEAGAKFNEVDQAVFTEAVQPLIKKSLNNDFRKKIYEKIQAAK